MRIHAYLASVQRLRLLAGFALILAAVGIVHAETAYFVCAGPRHWYDARWLTAAAPETYVAPVTDAARIATIREYLGRRAQGLESRPMVLVVRLALGGDGINRNYAAPGQPLWDWRVTETVDAWRMTGNAITADYHLWRDGYPQSMREYLQGGSPISPYGANAVGLIYFPVLMEVVPDGRGAVMNVSCRGRIDAEEPQLIAGLVVQGTAPKNVVVRVLGPSLGAFGVAAPLQKPRLQLYEGPRLVAENASWVHSNLNLATPPGNPVPAPAPLAPPHESEPGFRITLAPGAYTVVATGAEGSTGVALIEVYMLDD